MKQFLGAGVLAALAGLALPALAAAHPSVYTTTANVIKAGTTNELEPQTRYVVSNHGFTMVLRETNKLNATAAASAEKVAGVIGYNLIPGGWRAGKSFADVMAVGGTGAQAHATCLSPALTSEAVIKSWQGTDAFYNYIPFQSAAAGLEDDPATWLPKLTAAGFDVSKIGTAAAAEAECEKVAGNEYVPADATQTTVAALAAGPVGEATEPLNEEIEELETVNGTLTTDNTALKGQVDTLTTENTALKGQVGTLTTENADLKKNVFASNPLQSQVNSLTQQLSTANAEVAMLKAAATPLRLTLSKVSASGITATLSGPPSSKVAVVVSLTAAQAKKARLKSTTLAKQVVTLGADGVGTASLKLTSAAKKALKSFKGSVAAEATSADRFATAKGKFAR